MNSKFRNSLDTLARPTGGDHFSDQGYIKLTLLGSGTIQHYNKYMFVLAMLTPTLCAFPINAISLIALNTAVFRFGKN